MALEDVRLGWLEENAILGILDVWTLLLAKRVDV